MIVNYASSGINKLKALLNDDARVIIYDCHMFIVQATWPHTEAHNAYFLTHPHSHHWVCSERQALSLTSLALLVKSKHPLYSNILFEH